MNFNIKRYLAQSLCTLLAFSVVGIQAQEIEEVTVTAQKREQNQQDVPVALDAFSAEMLQQSSIKTMSDLASITPVLDSYQSQNSGFSSWGIRSLNTSSQNFGLESAVGAYVDGVYRSRQSAISNQLTDIEAVEVLRGPQGTLFGKNTSAGAVNIRTVAPSHDKNGFFEVVGGDYGLVNLNAAMNTSLIADKLAMRTTIFTSDRDGYVKNLSDPNGPKLNDRDRQGGRLQFLFTPSDVTSMRVIMDYAELDEMCCAALTKKNNLAHIHTGSVVAGTDAIISTAPPLGFGLPITLEKDFNKQEVYLTHPPRSQAEDSGLSLEINRDFENYTLTSITGIRNFETEDFGDVDFGAASVITDLNKLDVSSFTQELRMAGDFETPSGRDGNYVVGFFYHNQDVDNHSTLTAGIHTSPMLNNDPTIKQALDAINGIYAGTQAALIQGGMTEAQATAANPYKPAADTFPAGAYVDDIMSQDHSSYAFFGQVEVPVRDHWSFTLGLRYTNDEKDMSGRFPITVPGNPNNTIGPVADVSKTGPIFRTLGGVALGALDPATDAATIAPVLGPTYVNGFGFYAQPSLAPRADITASFESDKVNGNIKVAYQPNDDSLYYASYSTGYKAGGINTDRLGPGLEYVFQPEHVESLEIGAKLDLYDSLRVNVAVFKMEVTDLQLSMFQGNAFNLTNAGRTDGNGAEIDIIWKPTESTTIQLSHANVIGTLKDMEKGSCWIATPWHTGTIDPGAANANPDAAFCNRNGISKLEPEDRTFAALTQGFSLGGATGYLRLEHQSVSDSDTWGNGDPLHFRESFTFSNARLAFMFDDLNSELAFWVRNMSDERYYQSVFNTPLQDGNLRAYTTEPRTWGVNFRMTFD